MGRRLRTYLALFVAIAVVVGLAWRAADRWWASLGCYPAPPPGHFLAYCNSPQFGSYEHGVYYFNLQDAALNALKRSEVVFFGTSRAQFALSTHALRTFFAEGKIAPYLLGFGYNEAGAFPLSLVRSYRLRPKAMVILADPFFRNRSSSHIRAAEPIRWHIPRERFEYLQKQVFVRAGAWVCGLRPSLCESSVSLVYRSGKDGWWLPFRMELSPQYPVADQGLITYTAEMAAPDVEFAREFIAATGVSHDCVVLSAAPSGSVYSDAYVREMGKLLGVRVSLPRPQGLMTFDNSHLTPDSAERWSAALLADIGDTLVKCARG